MLNRSLLLVISAIAASFGARRCHIALPVLAGEFKAATLTPSGDRQVSRGAWERGRRQWHLWLALVQKPRPISTQPFECSKRILWQCTAGGIGRRSRQGGADVD